MYSRGVTKGVTHETKVTPKFLDTLHSIQGCNPNSKNLDATSAMVGRICPPPGGDRVKVSENLGVTLVAPVDASLV